MLSGETDIQCDESKSDDAGRNSEQETTRDDGNEAGELKRESEHRHPFQSSR
jgi:hypothetical protein